MKKKIKGLVCVIFIIIFQANIIVFAYDKYDNVSEVKSKVIDYINNNLKSEFVTNTGEKLYMLTLNNVDFENESNYQMLHNSLQNHFKNAKILDIYITSNKKIIVPRQEQKVELQNNNYNEEDIDFINALGTLGVKNVTLIDKKNNVKIPSDYYQYILYYISKIYNKYYYISNRYINTINNKLFNSLELSTIKIDNAVGEFVSDKNTISLSSTFFNDTYNNYDVDVKNVLEYTLNHEIGHAIELSICKKVFKDLNISNISSDSLETLAIMYFTGNGCEVSEQIRNTVLTLVGAPKNDIEREKFITHNLSKYANTNSSEFLAESIAYGNYVDETKNKQISKIVEQEIRNIFNKQGSTYNNIKNGITNFLKTNKIIE